MSDDSYLLAGQATEVGRLQLQSRVWEPAGRQLLEEIGDGRGARAVDLGCGPIGWLPLLSTWVGPDGQVVGTDIDDKMLSAADQFIAAEGLRNVILIKDDILASDLEPASFDLVHSRFELTPLGRLEEQMEIYLRLVRPGGIIVLEDLDWASLRFNPPPTPALDELHALVEEAFQKFGDIDAGRKHLELFRKFDIEASVSAEIVALPPGHPYLRVMLDMATGLTPRLAPVVGAEKLERLQQAAEAELQAPGRWGTTFTLLQAWGRQAA